MEILAQQALQDKDLLAARLLTLMAAAAAAVEHPQLV
jgi:hypothetical protein